MRRSLGPMRVCALGLGIREVETRGTSVPWHRTPPFDDKASYIEGDGGVIWPRYSYDNRGTRDFFRDLRSTPGTSAGVPSQKETRAPRDCYWTARDNDIWVLLLTAAADSVYTKRKANSWGFKPIYLIA